MTYLEIGLIIGIVIVLYIRSVRQKFDESVEALNQGKTVRVCGWLGQDKIQWKRLYETEVYKYNNIEYYNVHDLLVGVSEHLAAFWYLIK